ADETVNLSKERADETVNLSKERADETVNLSKERADETVNLSKERADETVNLSKERVDDLNEVRDHNEEVIDEERDVDSNEYNEEVIGEEIMTKLMKLQRIITKQRRIMNRVEQFSKRIFLNKKLMALIKELRIDFPGLLTIYSIEQEMLDEVPSQFEQVQPKLEKIRSWGLISYGDRDAHKGLHLDLYSMRQSDKGIFIWVPVEKAELPKHDMPKTYGTFSSIINLMLVLSLGVKESSKRIFDIKRENTVLKLSEDNSDDSDSHNESDESDYPDDSFEASNNNSSKSKIVHYLSAKELSTPLAKRTKA
ncbi:1269_t:CDS:2, partial [Racocetra fulgida]